MRDIEVVAIINKLLSKHKVSGHAYLDGSENFIIDYEGKMRNSSAFKYLDDLFYHSDLISKTELRLINELSKKYAVSRRDKMNGLIHL